MSKKALLVGINEKPLRGCINDVKAMRDLLVDLYGFQADGIRMLTDREATTQAIVDGLDWLAQGGSDQAVRVFHYAGHGHSLPDENGDEPDGKDEALAPYDHRACGYLIDDKLGELYDRFGANSNLTLIMDSCHSGTSQRGPEEDDVYYRFIPNTYEERQAIAAARRKFLQEQMQFVKSNMKTMRGSKRGPDEEFEKEFNAMMEKFEKHRFGDHRVKENNENNILLAACEDDQQAADARMKGGVFHGAFTYFLIKLVREANGKISYQELVKNLGRTLYDYSFKQVPQLSCKAGWENENFLSA
jgi:hypothetical protein